MNLFACNYRKWLAVLAIGLFAQQASADWHSFWHGIRVGTHRNNAWPSPFVEVDSMQTIAPFEVMKSNGWRAHNTIGHDLFRSGDGALLAAGNKRVEWIATQAPESRRDIFVLRGATPQETEARLASVRETLASMPAHSRPPAVWVSDIEPKSASGAWATQINRAWLENLPPPQLPEQSSSGTAGAVVQ